MAKSRDFDEMTPAEILKAFDGSDPIDIQPAPVANGKHVEQAKQASPQLPPVMTESDFLGAYVSPDYLIDSMLQRRFLYSLTGQTGHAKTAIALRIARLVGQKRGTRYLAGHEVEHGRVLYLVGENPDDVRMRVIGELGANPGGSDIYYLPGVFDIDKLFPALETAVAIVGDVALIIVDTSAAYFLGNEELSNTQMGDHARKLRRLTTLAGGPCVVALCHPTKHVIEPAQLLPRGGGAFLAEVDGNLTAWLTTDGVVELHHGKIRGPGFEPVIFNLEKVFADRLVDSKGRKLPTIRAVPVTSREQERAEESAGADEDLLMVRRLNGPARMSVADLAIACGWYQPSGEPYKSKVFRLCSKLVVDRLMRKYRTGFVLTESGKKAAREAEVAALPPTGQNTPFRASETQQKLL